MIAKRPTVAVIPARGGSKRIPRKNIRKFLGKPIISYSIEAAVSSDLFDEVMVSTDDEEIAEVAVAYGAKIPFFRSKSNSDDFATTYDVVEEVLNKYSEQNRSFDFACCLYACAPLVRSKDLKEAYRRVQEEKLDSVIPVTSFSFPIQRALEIRNNKLAFFNPEYAQTRSQDLEETYHDAGQFCFVNCKAVLSLKALLTNNTGALVIDETLVQDIDTDEDWKMAELKHKMYFEDAEI